VLSRETVLLALTELIWGLERYASFLVSPSFSLFWMTFYLFILFYQEGPIEIQYLFYQGVLVKIGSTNKNTK